MPQFSDPMTCLEWVRYGIIKRVSDRLCGGSNGNEGPDFLGIPGVEDPKVTRGDTLSATLVSFRRVPKDKSCLRTFSSLGRVVGPMPFGGVKVTNGGAGLQFEGGRSINGNRKNLGVITGLLPLSTDHSSDYINGQYTDPVSYEFTADMAQQTGRDTYLQIWGSPGAGLGPEVFDVTDSDFQYPNTGFARRGSIFRLVVFYEDATEANSYQAGV